VTIPKVNIVKFWRVWMYPLDPFVRLVSGMIATELQGRTVHCKSSELHFFDPPSGQTCGDYARAFLSSAGGYITNESATSQCGFCQYEVGQQFFEPLSIYFSERWMNLVSVSSTSYANPLTDHLSVGHLGGLCSIQYHSHPRGQSLPQVRSALSKNTFIDT
jgi:ABC-type multidrug transport system permease subunit